MIQELLGDAGLLVEERKISFSHGVLDGSSPSSSPSPSAAVATSTINNTTGTAALLSSSENLRCPRCDSSNTKFCYYNNYNLTQPRHFCKTCRRYWTKGGALRNIPIGGGCRKNKSTIATTINVPNSSSAGKSAAGKAKTASSSSSEIIKSLGSGLPSHHHQDSTVLWGSPQNSQLLALLRATQNNPNPNMLNSINIKDEGPMIGSPVNTESAVLGTSGLSARTLGLDPLGQVPNIGLFSSFWRNNQHQLIQQHQNQLYHQPQQSGLLLGEIQNAGVQELSQRVRSSSSNHYSTTDHSSQGFALTSNVPSSILEASSGSGGELGYWNPTFSWSDLPTNNASFP